MKTKTYFKCAFYALFVMAYSFILLPYLISQPNDTSIWAGIVALIIEIAICIVGARWIFKDLED